LTSFVSSGREQTRSLAIDPQAPLAGLLLTAAGMNQRWRQQIHQSVQLARAKRAKRDRLPLASRSRSQDHCEMLSLQSHALSPDGRGRR
jgi:hypothetical protein